MCGNDTRSPVTSRESAAHGHTQRGENTRRPPARRPQPVGGAAPARPCALGPHCGPRARPPHVAPELGADPLRKVTTLVPGECGPARAACERLAVSVRLCLCVCVCVCRAGGAGAHGLAAPIVPRAPLCPLGTPRLHGVPGARAPRPGREGGRARKEGGRAVERSAPPAPGRPHSRRAPALHPRRARDGAARVAGKLRDAGALALGRPVAGTVRRVGRREQGGGEREAREPRLRGTLPRGDCGGSEAAGRRAAAGWGEPRR